jgi:hypothetical protein
VEHLQHIQQVLHTLWQHKLYENLEKCSFGMNMVQYLGYIVDEHGVHVDPAKIQVIQVTRGDGKVKFVWGQSQQKAFDDLKQRLFSAPVLSLPNLQ